MLLTRGLLPIDVDSFQVFSGLQTSFKKVNLFATLRPLANVVSRFKEFSSMEIGNRGTHGDLERFISESLSQLPASEQSRAERPNQDKAH